MKVSQEIYLNSLIAETKIAAEAVRRLKTYGPDRINRKQSSTSWSTLECIEHLVRYGNFYLPELEKQLERSKTAQPNAVYKTSWLGDYFVRMVEPGNTKKMTSPKEMDATNSELNPAVLDQFLKQLDRFTHILDQSKNADIVRQKTAISLTKLVKLRFGDTLRFLVTHNKRHLLQAERAAKQNVSD